MKQLIPALFAVGAVMLLAGAAVYIIGLASFTLYIYYRRYDGCFGPN